MVTSCFHSYRKIVDPDTLSLPPFLIRNFAYTHGSTLRRSEFSSFVDLLQLLLLLYNTHAYVEGHHVPCYSVASAAYYRAVLVLSPFRVPRVLS